MSFDSLPTLWKTKIFQSSSFNLPNFANFFPTNQWENEIPKLWSFTHFPQINFKVFELDSLQSQFIGNFNDQNIIQYSSYSALNYYIKKNGLDDSNSKCPQILRFLFLILSQTVKI